MTIDLKVDEPAKAEGYIRDFANEVGLKFVAGENSRLPNCAVFDLTKPATMGVLSVLVNEVTGRVWVAFQPRKDPGWIASVVDQLSDRFS